MQAEKPLVLVVEDERLVARDLQQTLHELGYDAYAVASSADEALALAAERLPDVVLMDIQLKGSVDGIAAAQALKHKFDVPVIYVTAHADDATIERARASHAYGYLIKPVEAARLRSAIEVGLHKHRDDRKLRERERWLDTTLRSIADGVISVDLLGRVAFMNAAAETSLELSQQMAQGRPIDEVFASIDAVSREACALPLHAALGGGKPVSLQTVLSTKARGNRSILASLAPVVDEGRTLGAVLVFRDVTEQKDVEKQLEAADRLASLGTMAAGVAHEVNNPLLVVTANATLAVESVREVRSLLRADLEPGVADKLDSVEESVTDIHSAALRIGRVVSDLRGFARTSESDGDRADVARCVHWAVRTTTHELRQRAQVEVDVPELPEVRADESRLGQVLINLLLNAAQSIEPGQARGNRIGVAAALRGDEVVIEVEDTGCGIAPEVLPRIFDPFFTTKPFGVGTGLGLSICHAIMRSTGGRIEAQSTLGRGSLFRLHLPLAPKRELGEDQPRSSSSAPKRARILVVDDETIVLKAMRRILETQHDIVCAENGRRGLELVQAGPRFDLVFCDLMMPDMNGTAFYEELAKAHPELALRVVFLSGAAPTPELERFLATVKSRILEKPFDAKRLRQVVASLIMGSRW